MFTPKSHTFSDGLIRLAPTFTDRSLKSCFSIGDLNTIYIKWEVENNDLASNLFT